MDKRAVWCLVAVVAVLMVTGHWDVALAAAFGFMMGLGAHDPR